MSIIFTQFQIDIQDKQLQLEQAVFGVKQEVQQEQQELSEPSWADNSEENSEESQDKIYQNQINQNVIDKKQVLQLKEKTMIPPLPKALKIEQILSVKLNNGNKYITILKQQHDDLYIIDASLAFTTDILSATIKDNLILVITKNTKYLSVVNILSHQQKQIYIDFTNISSPFSQILIVNNKKYLVIGHNQKLLIIDLQLYKLCRSYPLSYQIDQLIAVENNLYIISKQLLQKFTFITINQCPSVQKININGYVTQLSGNQIYIAVGMINGMVDIYSADLQLIQTIKTATTAINSLLFTKDSQYLLFSDKENGRVYSLTQFQTVITSNNIRGKLYQVNQNIIVGTSKGELKQYFIDFE